MPAANESTAVSAERVAPARKRRVFLSDRLRNGTLFPGGTFLSELTDDAGVIDIGRVADIFHMSRPQLAETIGLATATVTKTDRRAAPKTQARVTEMLEIIARVHEWAGGEAQAMAWYRSQPIPALDGRTSEALVKSGRAGAVRAYLDHVALGGYA